jgi:cupin fold WbuC family metalloprotein
MFIDKEILDALSEEARKSPRLRMGMDMRTSADDQSQRMLNAMEPGTEVAIHRHMKTTETVAVIRGKLRQKYYDEKGQLVREDIIEAGGACPFYMVPKGMWHTTECLETGTIIFDCKDGAYESLVPADIMSNN